MATTKAEKAPKAEKITETVAPESIAPETETASSAASTVSTANRGGAKTVMTIVDEIPDDAARAGNASLYVGLVRQFLALDTAKAVKVREFSTTNGAHLAKRAFDEGKVNLSSITDCPAFYVEERKLVRADGTRYSALYFQLAED